MIVLVGFMGAGKTTVGQLVAEALDVPFADADDLLTVIAGRPIAQIFADDGETAFRALEERVLADVLTHADGVLALGGGACESAVTRAALAGHTVVHLDVSYDEALRRVGDDPGRPVLADPALPQRYSARRGLYAEVADAAVSVDGRTPEQVAEAVLAVVEGASRDA